MLKCLSDAIRSLFEGRNILSSNFISVFYFNKSLVWFGDRPAVEGLWNMQRRRLRAAFVSPPMEDGRCLGIRQIIPELE